MQPSAETRGSNPYVDPGSKPATERTLLHLDSELHEALKRWSADQDRSMSAQVRVALRELIPDKYFGTSEGGE